MRQLLLIVLGTAFLLELGLTGGAFLYSAFTLAHFQVKYGPETAFLAYSTGWLLLLALLAFVRVWQRQGYAGLCYLLGWWRIGLGIGIYVACGRPDNLLLDSLKGLLLVVLTWRG